jgi:hypothetical protein
VVATPFGFHVLRVDQRAPMAFDVVKTNIANELATASWTRWCKTATRWIPRIFRVSFV